MELLKPEMVDEAKLVDLQKAMMKDLRIAARKFKGKPVWFVVAADVPLSDRTKVALFVTMKTEAEAKAWQVKLKGKKPRAVAIGTCISSTEDGVKVGIRLDKVAGSSPEVALNIAKLAFRMDKAVTVTNPASEKKASESQPQAKAVAGAAASVDAMIDQLDADNADIRALLDEFKGMGLDDAAIKAALQETLR